MEKFKNYRVPYKIDTQYAKKVAYFSMEFAIAQPLKIYSGGLGFLAGSHMRSAYDLKQNLVGIGILWKYGYYDQIRNPDQTMNVLFQEKIYSFLEDTGIQFQIEINQHPVFVKALYLAPETFGTAPMFFLSTDVRENDYLAQTTSHKLYDSDKAARIAQYVLLGIGGSKLLDLLGFEPEVYHFNEAHALSSCFYLYSKFQSLDQVKAHTVFTTHTPEEAGNEKTDIRLLDKMGFFNNIPLDTVRQISGVWEDTFNHTLVALRFSQIANAVSKIHGAVSNRMWRGHDGICKIKSITNAQNAKYWADNNLNRYALEQKDQTKFFNRKRVLKEELFEVVADQTGKIFDPNKLTIVWSRRFAGYKRADLVTQSEKAIELIENSKYPIQIIWAGKPYPMDFEAVSTFNRLVHFSKGRSNVAVLVGYELRLSALLKKGADIWLNTPRITREASGTSGMTAAMNGAVNFSTFDGWIPEFARHGKNCFVVPEIDITLPLHEQDQLDLDNILKVLEEEILPAYYDAPSKWFEVVQNSMAEIVPKFDSGRMADEYYKEMYNYKGK